MRRIASPQGLLLLDTRPGTLYAFSDSARDIWDLVEHGRPAREIVPEFAAKWRIPVALAEADVQAILAHWHGRGLFEEAAVAAAAPAPASDASAAGQDRVPERTQKWTEEWTCTIRGRVLGFAIAGDLAATTRAMFRHLETSEARSDVRIEVRRAPAGEAALLVAGRERIRTSDAALLAGALWQAVLEIVHPAVDWLALIHGGAVAKAGQAVGICGPSGSGKSTLIASLVGRGLDYLSDDMLPLAKPGGAVIPLPLPQSIKPGSFEVLADRHPELVGTEVYRTKGLDARLLVPEVDVWATPPHPLRALVFPRFRAGSAAELVPLSFLEALERQLNERIWLGNPMTEAGVAAFVDWLQAMPGFALSYGSAEDSLRLMDRVLDRVLDRAPA